MDQQPGNFSQLVALFLAEALRSRRTSLARAAEISSRVIKSLPQMNSEAQALLMLTEIEKDFEEVVTLKQALHFGYHPSDIKTYETEIKAFASKFFEHDLTSTNNFLQDASRPGMNIQQLCVKYPAFCDYLFAYSDKAEELRALNIRQQDLHRVV